MHCIQCKDYNASFNALYPYYTILCIVFIYCILSIMLYAFYSMHLIQALYALYSMHCILCIVFYALYSFHYILFIVLYALYILNLLLKTSVTGGEREEGKWGSLIELLLISNLDCLNFLCFFRVWVGGDGYVEIYVCWHCRLFAALS